jgi:xylan 1,4-beta-xylosidase
MKSFFHGDLNTITSELPHFWEHTVGSGHATLALRSDWQAQLKQVHEELGFKHVRFHGLFCDDMGTLVCQKEKLIYSFFNIDQIFDYLISIGMKPFVEISFMPEAIASGKDQVFHYHGNVTPPEDQDKWKDLIHQFGTHLLDRYGKEEIKSWYFEVWNEPNLKAFWTGTQEEYFHLYSTTVTTLKNIEPGLQVGGPATAKNSWLPEFRKFCESNQLPYDFISTHHYPTDALGSSSQDTKTQLELSKRSVLRDEAQHARDQVGNTPLFYTEWSSSSNPFDELHDDPYAAAFIIKTILEARGLVQGYSYWTFSDIFEENYFSSVPFHGGFGLTNINGIPKPSYRAYEMLHRLGNQMFKMEGHHPTVDCWGTVTGNQVTLIATHFERPGHPITTQGVGIELEGLSRIQSSTIERIDQSHANAKAHWKSMGEPPYLSQKVRDELKEISKLKKENIKVHLEEKRALLNFEIEPEGCVLITLEIER